MLSAFLINSVLLPAVFSIYYVGYIADCVHEWTAHRNGSIWVHGEFNLTCLNGKITVINCITETGVKIPLGTHGVQINGIEYSCMAEHQVEEGSGDSGSGEEPFYAQEEPQRPAILEEDDVDCGLQTKVSQRTLSSVLSH
ncbi:hypothetical protein L596_006078 [Steinernema carpocapsae]|uniref:Uncharacterized protein n=1 Tax=Steinernema carpocapsae TaxID=34508 RepID=A0A4U8V6E2_STECR|nr:hypothetical protein L596_006078 [Steinernema carpocapsae]